MRHVRAWALLFAALPLPCVAATTTSVTWNGSMRFRYEARSVLDYRLPGTQKRPASQALGEGGDVSLMRLRVGAAIRWAPLVRGEFVVQDARVMGVEGSPSGAIDNVDLYLAFVDVDSLGGRPLAVRVGRQVFEYGDGLVVAGSTWGNPGRAWDGARVRWATAHGQLDGIASWVMEGRVQGGDRLFGGLDALWRESERLEWEGYAFARSFGDTMLAPERGGARRPLHDRAFGLRAKWKRGAFELRGEGALQRGDRAGDPVRAYFTAARAGLGVSHRWKPRVWGEMIVASGDPDPRDGEANRWDPYYWNSHSAQGSLDLFGRANDVCTSVGAEVQPVPAVRVQSEFVHLSLVRARDGWYDDAGTILRVDPTGRSGREVGIEHDLTVRWDARPGIGLLAGWSHFAPGAFVRRTGGAPRTDWAFAQMTATF